MSTLKIIEKAFDETVGNSGSFNDLGWPEHIGWLIDKNKRYKQALEELRNYVMNLPIDREEDGSPVEDPFGRLVYEVTNQALEESK